MKTKAHAVTRGSSNIFADLGLPNADEHMLKARVVIFIGKRIEQLGLTQQAAAKRMGVKQPDVSNILRGRFHGFALGRLLGFVRALGNDVEIRVRRPTNDKNSEHEGRMSFQGSPPARGAERDISAAYLEGSAGSCLASTKQTLEGLDVRS